MVVMVPAQGWVMPMHSMLCVRVHHGKTLSMLMQTNPRNGQLWEIRVLTQIEAERVSCDKIMCTLDYPYMDICIENNVLAQALAQGSATLMFFPRISYIHVNNAIGLFLWLNVEVHAE
ncbi:hypothetical protein KC19_VG258300 [Ceratodon purpureus]|uniref:Uncharacterized protein n=1 Tax=Ceratodon purpureus TaxID=3225 RepID=A0A8T0HV17_CERPU|nr:hypothetical protein KC19_VG258300 [Ceratodon purpureus]